MGFYNIKAKQNESKMAFEMAQNMVKLGKNPVFLCLGNSNIVADMLGAYVGSELKILGVERVYGTLTDNVKASNFHKVWDKIKTQYPLSPIIIVDATLGEDWEVGYVKCSEYGCIPSSTNNNIVLGDMSILGITFTTSISDYLLLKSVRYDMVKSMALFLARVIKKATILSQILSVELSRVV